MMLYLGGALLFLFLIFIVGKKNAGKDVYSRFGLSASKYRLISSDLGDQKSRFRLSHSRVNGIPDAVFTNSAKKEVVVGEFKSRKYAGNVRLYEFYQLQLYIGHMLQKYPDHSVSGVLAYADDRVVINFDKSVYEGLLALRGEYWDAVTSHRSVVRGKPLHQRMKVNTQNRKLRFSARL